MDTPKNIWNRINEYVEEHDIWLMPLVLLGCFGIIICIAATLPDPKPTNSTLENVKKYIGKMEYEGHTYLVYKRQSCISMCHDENCKCKEQ